MDMCALYVVSDNETISVLLNMVQLRQCLAYVAVPTESIHLVFFNSIQLLFFRSASGLSSDVLRGLKWRVIYEIWLSMRSNDVMRRSRTLSSIMLEKLVDQR